MTEPSTGPSTPPSTGTPYDEGTGHGTPSQQHGDPLLAAAQGRDEGEGSRHGRPDAEPERPAG